MALMRLLVGVRSVRADFVTTFQVAHMEPTQVTLSTSRCLGHHKPNVQTNVRITSRRMGTVEPRAAIGARVRWEMHGAMGDASSLR